jgi:hypothetical protein
MRASYSLTLTAKALVVTAFLALCSPSAASSDDAIIDSILNTYGLQSLSDEQRVAARSLVRSMISDQSNSETLSKSAEEYMRGLGYKPVRLEVVESNGKTYLLETDGILTYATSDVPFGVGALTFERGEYFAKPNILGGVSEFIDKSGRPQRLLFANWFVVR